jgi:hypothetical protein
MISITARANVMPDTLSTPIAQDDWVRGEEEMRHARVHDHSADDQYARVESAILDLQLSIASVRRANVCLDLHTVRAVRTRAAETLAQVELRLTNLHTETWQKRRLGERRRTLALLLEEPAPIEHLARSLRVG